MSPKVFIITVNWNSFAVLSECLDSLRALDYGNFSTVVVDNGSTDNSVSQLRAGYPEIVLIEAKVNLGLTGANNIGMRYALEHGAEYCLILNNDTVVDRSLLRELLKASEESPDAAVFAPKIYYFLEPTRIWWGRSIWDKRKCRFINNDFHRYDHETDARRVEDIDFANGCALFVKASVIQEIGLMDERFFIYFEEIDWCSRIKKAGFRILFVPDAKLWHKVAASSGGRGSAATAYYEMRNQLLWAKKHLSFKERIRFSRSILRSFLKATCSPSRHALIKRIFWDLKSFATPAGKAKVRGILDYMRQRFGRCPEYIYALNKTNKDRL